MKTKNHLISTLACLLTFLIIVDLAWAADGAYIAVTCSIPEVPGLNAPLIETKTLKADINAVVNAQENIPQNKENSNGAANAKEITEQKEIVLSQNINQPTVVETSYSR